MEASGRGHTATVQALFGAGADLNLQDEVRTGNVFPNVLFCGRIAVIGLPYRPPLYSCSAVVPSRWREVMCLPR
jgi:hypothetical protein